MPIPLEIPRSDFNLETSSQVAEECSEGLQMHQVFQGNRQAPSTESISSNIYSAKFCSR